VIAGFLLGLLKALVARGLKFSKAKASFKL
jgi:hypothetical protein